MVQVDDLILVKLGEKVFLDGEILGGILQVDILVLIGELVFGIVKFGDIIFVGMIN